MKLEGDGNLVLKYCGLLDTFVKLRIFSEAELSNLLRVESLPNRSAYRQLVVNACILDFSREVTDALESGRATEREKVEESLYQLCVEVNPKLEISQVTIPIVGPAARREPLPLLGGPAPAKESAPRRLFDAEQIANLTDDLRKRVIGQEAAVQAVARAVRKTAVGLRRPNRPVGAFLFVGKTGVGKTELAKALTETLYRDESRLIRIDCSEYALPHEYAKLIGAPPGYIGHDEGGILTSWVAAAGPGVVLLDEIEKAHSKLHNLLLQVIDEGCLTDSKGVRVSFADTIVILTSNVGMASLERWRNPVGFSTGRSVEAEDRIAQDAATRGVREQFAPEFINRLDEVVVFQTLRRSDCLRIVNKMLRELAACARRNGLTLQFTRRLREAVVRRGYDEEYGARELRRTLTQMVEDPLADWLIQHGIADDRTHRLIRIDHGDGGAVFDTR